MEMIAARHARGSRLTDDLAALDGFSFLQLAGGTEGPGEA